MLVLVSQGWAGNGHPLCCSPQGRCLRMLYLGPGKVCGCTLEGSGQSTALKQSCSEPFRSRPDPLQRSALLTGAAHARCHRSTGSTGLRGGLCSGSLLQALKSFSSTNLAVASLPYPSPWWVLSLGQKVLCPHRLCAAGYEHLQDLKGPSSLGLSSYKRCSSPFSPVALHWTCSSKSMSCIAVSAIHRCPMCCPSACPSLRHPSALVGSALPKRCGARQCLVWPWAVPDKGNVSCAWDDGVPPRPGQSMPVGGKVHWR